MSKFKIFFYLFLKFFYYTFKVSKKIYKNMEKINWIIYAKDRKGKIIFFSWFGLKPQMSKIYKNLKKKFCIDFEKIGFISFDSLEKSDFWIDYSYKFNPSEIEKLKRNFKK